MAILGGFINIKQRMNDIPELFKIILFCYSLFTLFLPITFFNIDGNLSFLWLWGYYSNFNFMKHFIGMKYSFLFISTQILPICIIISSVSLLKFKSFIIYFNLLLYLICLFYNFYLFHEISQIFGLKYTIWSPMYSLFAIFIHSRIIFWLIINFKNKKNLIKDNTPLVL